MVVPIAHVKTSSDVLGAGVLRRFLHLTLEETVLKVLMEEIVTRFTKLYPDEDQLEIVGLQDQSKCDLDPDFTVGDVFDSGDVIQVICANEVYKHRRMSYSPTTNANTFNVLETPSSRTKSSSASSSGTVIQSTPLPNPAPVLTELVEVPQNDIADEYFHTTNHKLPTKKTGTTKVNTPVATASNGVKIKTVQVTKPKGFKSATAKDASVTIVDPNSTQGGDHNDSNVSLPPPLPPQKNDVLQSRIIPKKRVTKPSFDLSGTSSSTTPNSGKRVTSGMLNVPLHTQIHSEIIQGSSPKSVTQQKVIISSEDLFEEDSSLEELKVEQEFYEDQSSDEIEKAAAKVDPSNVDGETMDKEDVLNLFRNEGRNLQRLKRNLQIDMVNPPKFDGTRAPRAAAKKASSMLKDTHKPQVPAPAPAPTVVVKVESSDLQNKTTGNSALVPNSMSISGSKDTNVDQATSSIPLVNPKPGRPRKINDSRLSRIEQEVQESTSETTKSLFNVLQGYSKLEADPENFKPTEIKQDGREFIPAILLHASPKVTNIGPTEVSTNKRKRRTKNKASNTQQPMKSTPNLDSKNPKNLHESSSSESDRSESSGSESDDLAETRSNKKPRLVMSQPNRLDHTGVKQKAFTPAVNKIKQASPTEKTPIPNRTKVNERLETNLRTPSANLSNGGGSITKSTSILNTPGLLSSIKKPTLASLTSLQDLQKKGTPDVHDGASPNPASIPKKVVPVSSGELDSESEVTSDNESSYSSSSNDEDENDVSAKFITTKKVSRNKTPKLKNRLSSLFSRK